MKLKKIMIKKTIFFFSLCTFLPNFNYFQAENLKDFDTKNQNSTVSVKNNEELQKDFYILLNHLLY